MDRVPGLPLGDGLLVSIQVDLEDQLAVALQEDLADLIVSTGAHGVIIDITALDIVDSFVGRMLATIAAVSKVLDAETVVVGMRPAVAITLVELGLPLRGIRTALNLEMGLNLLRAAQLRAFGEAFGHLAFAEARPVEVGHEVRRKVGREPGHRRPAAVSAAIHGMTSSSISSSVVVASKPRTSRDLRTSGTRSWTSCSNGGSLT